MESVAELRARILKLDTEIDLQRELLKKLEHDRNLARRQLNATFDPMARLPFEISSEIFLLFRGAPHVPTVLLNICHAWADIALATPSLWTAVHIDFPCRDGLAEVLPIWFQRARNRPLSMSISLRGHSLNWNYSVSSVFWRHAGQLKHLEISDDDTLEEWDDGAINLFGGATLVSLPFLETLSIRCQLHQRVYSVSQLLNILRQAPNITECIFDNCMTDDYDSDSGTVVIPTLRRLIFENHGECEILRHLSLPALETLSIPMFVFSAEELLAFVKRSAAPLQDLTLDWEYSDTEFDQLLECLQLIPSLLRFRMSEPESGAVPDLFAALAESSSLLPKLRNLAIDILPHGPFGIADSSWRMLVRALSTRHIQLHIVHITVSPPADVLDACRELIRDGVEIYIGTEEHNFVVA
ncbi:hypothetical protein C8R45DRAFT_1068649 [Mycena sanguinolenta]|nr:hypothetical protein C8R45DRAFT_1068649 [Mycena sanguinolenta]